ncbi:phage tail tape measure protein [Microbacterium lacus]|uniref:phage tail tape measure protein n=1 Tax=Microbacterium lacus TaxID=415217 RepID=UPI000C2BFCD5|nr:phage tail tape measure protein [Microbacterium lacus]
MVDRQVKVTLSAQVAGFKKGMQEAATATRKVGTESEKLAQTRAAFDSIGRSSLAMGALIGAGVTVAVAKFAEFDAAMANVAAASNESAENMVLLREAAIDAGASTVFSATEAAGAIEELAKAGVSTADILSGALAGSLDLAAAGQLGVARAAEITSTALNQFGLSGDQAGHVADVLAAGAGKAMGSVEDLANGLKFVGPVAASMGVSLEETTGVLALFAQQGIIGEQAGTSLRGVLSSLTSPSAQARGEIEKLGLTLYDSSGNFLGLENAAGQLSKAYNTMDGASRDASMGIIFGRETVTAATALYKAGASGVDDWTEAVDDSGFAAEVARKRLDNLKGDLEALQGALDSALIQTGSAANETLRSMAQALTGLVQMYGDLPEPVQQATLIIGGATAAVALAGGTALLAVPKFIEMKSTITGAGISMKGLSLTAAGAGLALGGLFAIVGGLAQQQAEARATAESYADTLEEGSRKITDATKRFASERLQATPGFFDNLFGRVSGPGSVFDSAEKLGIELNLVTEAAVGSSDAIAKLAPYLQKIGDGSSFAAEEAERLGLSQYQVEQAALKVTSGIQGEAESLEEASRLARQKEEANKGLTDSTEESAEVAQTAAEAYLTESDAVSDVAGQLTELIATINEANGVGQDAVSANISYGDALAKVDETIRKAAAGQEGYALTLDQNTQAGRDNLGMLNDLAAKSQAAADAQFALDGNTDTYRSTLEAGRQAVIDSATALGANADEATRLADQIYRIPTEREMEVIVETRRAEEAIVQLTRERQVNIMANVVGGSIADRAERAQGRAYGGPIFGPGGPRDDLIPAMLSNGEHVWTAAEVEAAGGHDGVASLRRAVLAGGYANELAYTNDGGTLAVIEGEIAAPKFVADHFPAVAQ